MAYINKAELVENLDRFAPEHFTPLIRTLLEKQPTADVVEVVRCEDCIHSKEYPMRMICRRFGRDTTENVFCSYGERRTDNDL